MLATKLLSAAGLSGWDLSKTTYVSQTSNSGGSTFFMRPDGTQLFLLVSDRIYTVALSTSWQISSRVPGFTNTTTLSSNARGLFFTPDGLTMYILDFSKTVRQYALASPWVPSISSLVRSLDISVFTTATDLFNLFFSRDGAYLFFVTAQDDTINKLALSTPWNISTATLSQKYNATSTDTVLNGMFFKPDGSQMFLSGYVNDRVSSFSLGAAFDISAPVFISDISISANSNNPSALFFKPNGKSMYVLAQGNGNIAQYNL